MTANLLSGCTICTQFAIPNNDRSTTVVFDLSLLGITDEDLGALLRDPDQVEGGAVEGQDAIDGQGGVRAAGALKHLIAANGRASSLVLPDPLPWITEAMTALGRNEPRDRTLLMGWLKRDGRSIGDPSKTPWCGDFDEPCTDHYSGCRAALIVSTLHAQGRPVRAGQCRHSSCPHKSEGVTA